MKLFHIALAGALSLAAFAGSAISAAAADLLTIQLKDGPVVIQLMPEVAPKHVAQIEALAKKGAYDNVVFHRVIDGFMAQTGDVQYGNATKGYDPNKAGTGGSDLPNLPAEFSKVPFQRGTVGMARAQDPNSANSQFFIMFANGDFLNGQYTVVGKVVSGMELVDKIKRGEGQNGEVSNPDKMVKVTVTKK
ncbi:peptidylprolyl isomerase [Rhizobium sp. P40RR-XXII]|uniref:peptidylprolyl isomerase n=1 Tax=unclassified Rhizobium TaxID=2613769 RepID=UPI0014573D20|nr:MULTISPECIES: peptidylprolyl isomerase [unclassified Rhizobium]NLR83550.1 peptidylprolyl isomerase [Rhizobium sp. P28RR-XV]NLS15970.1 peptidylprolyl isomerase [Rhizobium sp. P40RR-XXII]